jgi:hypothetical protein
MQNVLKSPENHSEETVSYKNFIKGFSKSNSFASSVNDKRPNTIKIPNSNFNPKFKANRLKSSQLEFDCVGEEGTAQLIRSPIVKRGKSTNSSIDLADKNAFMGTEKLFKSIQDKLQTKTLENLSLKQEIQILNNKLLILLSTIADLNIKISHLETQSSEIEKKFNSLLIENKKTLEENEKLSNMLIMLVNDPRPSEQLDLHEDLEAKILSLDKEKDEKHEQYQQILLKYLGCLHEFAAAEDWVLSIIRIPFPIDELIDCEEMVKERIERIQAEISYCQYLMSCEKTVEKSYYTSVSSSVPPSPLYSPNRTVRVSTINDLISILDKDTSKSIS